jgi:hypothetical protein
MTERFSGRVALVIRAAFGIEADIRAAIEDLKGDLGRKRARRP